MTISVFQASDWDDEDAVLGASICVVADAGENHEEGGFILEVSILPESSERVAAPSSMASCPPILISTSPYRLQY